MRKFLIILAITTLINVVTVHATEVPRESLPCNATEEQIIVTERLVGHIFDEVINGLGYSDARAKSNVIIFNAWLNNQTSGYAFGELINIVGHRINPLEQRLGQGAKTDTTLWIGGTKEFRESTLLDMGGFAAVGNVGYRSAIQKSNDALVFIPKFLKNRTENKQIH